MSLRYIASNKTRLANTPADTGAMFAALAIAAMPFASAHAAPDPDSDNPDHILVVGERQADANPNADPEAPYKVDRSADGKFTEPLRDTPKTVTAIPREVIEDIGATSFRDVVRSTPGVTLGTGEGGNAFGDRIFIRGFDARGDVYIDGLRDPGVTSREVFAVEQIEVVKGPSGSFGGRGTTGGLVSLQSKRPQLGNDFVSIEGGIGTENFYRATVDANYQLGEGFAVRLNGLYHNADTPGRDHVGAERWGVAAAALWQATDTLSIAADYYGYRLDGMSDYGHPFDVATQRPYKVNADNFYGAVGRDFLDNGADIGTVTVKFEPSDRIALRSTVRYGETWNYYVVSVPRAPDTSDPDPANWTVSTGAPQRHGDNSTFAMLADATVRLDTGSISHTLVGGVEISREKVVNRRYTFPSFIEDANGNPQPTPGIAPLNLFDPNPLLGFRIPALLDTTATPALAKVETMSAYLIDTVEFSPQWKATLGLRYDAFDIRLSGASRGTNYDVNIHPEFLNYQASLLYKPVEAASLYASFSTSSNPSGEQLDSASPTYGGGVGVENLKPERNKAYEIGAKLEVNQHLLVTAAIFQIDKDNAREQDPANGTYQLVGGLRSRGAEIGVSGNITPRWSAFGGFTLLDAKIVSSADPATVGSRFPNVPKYNFSLLSTYAVTD
ncbi:MAG: TonB-dependent receptor, partial [Sphingobium sp.]